MSAIVGWDLGGANLKLALMEGARVTRVEQIPCPLVPHRGKFDTALAETLKLCPEGASHAVTMTGELSDVFEDRAEGVAYLVGLMREAVGGAPLLIYGGRAGFLDPDDAVGLPMDVASANWRASATLAAALCPDGLFVDMGTTTTDLVPLKAASRHAAIATGAANRAGCLCRRRAHAVMAVARGTIRGAARGSRRAIATMADVFRLPARSDDADPPSADLCCRPRGQRVKARAHARPRSDEEASTTGSTSRAISPIASSRRSKRRRGRSSRAKSSTPTRR
jgi:probable H4MPT-linked C1 transfer pathway protein